LLTKYLIILFKLNLITFNNYFNLVLTDISPEEVRFSVYEAKKINRYQEEVTLFLYLFIVTFKLFVV